MFGFRTAFRYAFSKTRGQRVTSIMILGPAVLIIDGIPDVSIDRFGEDKLVVLIHI